MLLWFKFIYGCRFMTTKNECMDSEIVLCYCLVFYEIEIKAVLVPIFFRCNSSEKVITCKFVEFYSLNL